MLIPRGVPVADENRVPYSRASGLADYLDQSNEYLWMWKMKGLAVGLGNRPDLVQLAAAETYTCGFPKDEAENRASGRRLLEIIDRALDTAGISVKADYGTAVHQRTEPGNTGFDTDLKEEADVQSCLDLWAERGVSHIGTEVFTANDETMSAGTFDGLDYVPGLGIVFTDKKTSRSAKGAYHVQVASYANSDIYDPETDLRVTPEEYVEARGWDPSLINRDVGIIWWIKGGRTQERRLDLISGWRAAKEAAWVRDNHQALGVAKDRTKAGLAATQNLRTDLMTRIEDAPSVDFLLAYWEHPQYRAIWTFEHTNAATARKLALNA